VSSTSSAQRADRLVIGRYSTDPLPAKERYAAWHLREWPRAKPIYRTDPIEPFDCRWEWAQLGQVMFVHTEITGLRWERRLDDIRISDFDPLIVSLMKTGEAQGDFDGRAFHETAGTFHFHDLGRPSVHVSTASETYNLVIPRSLASRAFGALEDLHGLVVPEPRAALLFAHAEQVRRLLPTLTIEAGERLGWVFLDLLSVALDGLRPAPPGPVSGAHALRARAVALLETELGLGETTVEALGASLGVSRNRLFEAFKPDGGVRAFITVQRLERARAALADLGRNEPIGSVADRLGFSDPAHFSRLFRQRYGMTPREYRHLVRSDADLLARAGAGSTDQPSQSLS
jgi:AraC-like DNA-binding protein